MYSVERTEEKPVICKQHLQGVLKVNSVFFKFHLLIIIPLVKLSMLLIIQFTLNN